MTAGQYAGQMDIRLNTISNNIPGNSVAGNYVTNLPVNLTNVTGGGATTMVTGATMRVDLNNLVNSYRGIYINNFTRPVTVEQNTIQLTNDPNAGTSQYGIALTKDGTTGIESQSNVRSNNISYAGASFTAGFINNYLVNYYVSAVTNMVFCSNVSTSGYIGFCFNLANPSMSNPSLTFTNNTIHKNHAYGFVIDNGAVMGSQGNGLQGCGNYWDEPFGISTGGYKLGVFGTAQAVNSTLYVQNSTSNPLNYNPVASQYAVDATVAYKLNSSIIKAVSNIPVSCSTAPTARVAGSDQMENEAKNVENIAITAVQYSTDLINKTLLYSYLDANPEALENSGILKSFYDEKGGTSVKYITQLEKAFKSGDLTASERALNDVNPGDNISTNYKNYYSIYLSYLKNGKKAMSGSMLKLESLAGACPFADGVVVYDARALYSALYDANKIFYNECEASARTGKAIESAIPVTSASQFDAMVYPNPGTGMLNISTGKTDGQLQVIITDVTGKSVYTNTLQLTDGKTNFETKVSEGIYLMTIIDSDTKERVIKKLIIKN